MTSAARLGRGGCVLGPASKGTFTASENPCARRAAVWVRASGRGLLPAGSAARRPGPHGPCSLCAWSRRPQERDRTHLPEGEGLRTGGGEAFGGPPPLPVPLPLGPGSGFLPGLLWGDTVCAGRAQGRSQGQGQVGRGWALQCTDSGWSVTVAGPAGVTGRGRRRLCPGWAWPGALPCPLHEGDSQPAAICVPLSAEDIGSKSPLRGASCAL